MDHQDIADMIATGDTEAAIKVIAERDVKGGISGHDMQTLDALLAGQKVEEQPKQKETRIAANEETGDLEVVAPSQSPPAGGYGKGNN